jgi:hypothetical protein
MTSVLEDESKAVSRKAAVIALAAVVSLEIGVVVWSAAAAGYRQGILRTRDLLALVLISGTVVGQAGAVWVVVARDAAASPARRAVLCLTIALAVGLPTFVSLGTDGPPLLGAVAGLSFSLAAMSAAILIAIGIGRIYFSLTSRNPSSRTPSETGGASPKPSR